VKRMFQLSLVIAALAGCAAAPMEGETWQATVRAEADRLGLDTRCCSELAEVPVIKLHGRVDLLFDESASVVMVEGRASPALRLDLETINPGASLEFFSYSDKKRGALRLGALTFIRPSFTFVNSKGSVLLVKADVPVCYGAKDGYGGVWSRVEIPRNAASVVISSGIAKPVAIVDTRRLGASPGAVTEVIAASRESYINELRIGRAGIATVEAVSPDAGPLGRCVMEG
jgi:hypothetical protein